MELGILGTGTGTGCLATAVAGAWRKSHEITLGSRAPGSKRQDDPVRSPETEAFTVRDGR